MTVQSKSGADEFMSSSSTTFSSKRSAKRSFLTRSLIIVAVLVFAGSAVYYFLQYQNTQELLKNPALSASQEAEELIEKVDKHVELPKGETPTIANVSDAAKLKGQPFFANAQNGDKVLIYAKAKKAVIYRPSINKVIEFSPINLGSTDQNTATPSANITLRPVRISLHNGTNTVGLANAVEQDLKSKASHVKVVLKGNAAKRDYKKTVVVDVTGGFNAEAQNLAQLLSGDVGKLPKGEVASTSADIVVILGRP